MMEHEKLPVYAALPRFRQAFAGHKLIILSAAPGAGKTSVIPQEAAACSGGVVRLIEPRRVAAGAAACRIAELTGGEVGGFAGYAVRGESRRSSQTKILAVTPGIMIREMQSDPALDGVDVIIFDEFHERSWECDLLLAFALDIQENLRPDLRIVIMSATLAADSLRSFFPDAAMIGCPGREYPVEVKYVPSDCSANWREIINDSVRETANLFRNTESGDILVFLPGAGEISAAAGALEKILPETADIRQLHGALEFAEQNRLLKKNSGKRRIFLATNLAESSITIDGVTAVVDCGWEKRMTFSPGAGMSFLELQRISRASADQRAGRAGRTAPGVAVRLYSHIEYNNMIPQRPPELTVCDLAPFALHLAVWGTPAESLRWLDKPSASGMESAFGLLRKLGAVDDKNMPTARGRELNCFPLHPRLGNMLIRADEEKIANTAAAIAAILEDRRGCRGSADIRQLLYDIKKHPDRCGAVMKIIRQLKTLTGSADDTIDLDSAGRLITFAYPEWIAQRRDRNSVNYRLAGGRAGELDMDDPLRGSEFLAVAALGGTSGKNARIILAAPLEKDMLQLDFADRLSCVRTLDFDPGSGKVSVREEIKLDSLLLESRPAAPLPGECGRAALAAAVKRRHILPPENFKKAAQLIDRVRFACGSDPGCGLPDWSVERWEECLAELTSGYLDQVHSIPDLMKIDWDAVIEYGLDQEQRNILNRLYPEFFITARGHRIRIDYSGNTPSAAVRIQELYGVNTHPSIGRNKIPLRLELLSPAGRPVQITMDLPGFWQGSWSLVRKDMRGRYPKHDWPEHPETV